MERQIACMPTGVHWGNERFPTRPRPCLKAWRCELTGLSHIHNLYFLASNDTIHVYRPTFPDQQINPVPDLIVRPPLVGNFDGYIDLVDPHSITRIHVDYLGQEEILLATCDDGDIIGYYTEHIQSVLDRRSHEDCFGPELIEESEVKPFFTLNVGASAWGLAVHRKARMIAVSANTHQITVLAYALTDKKDDLDLDSSSDLDPEFDMYIGPDFDLYSTHTAKAHSKLSQDFPAPRKNNNMILLQSTNNIPSVSFNNSGTDPAGRWICSTSIDGSVKLWDLHNLGLLNDYNDPYKTINLRWCSIGKRAGPDGCCCMDGTGCPHATWAGLFLDTRAIHQISAAEAILQKPVETAPDFLDVTTERKRFTAGVYSSLRNVSSYVSEEHTDQSIASEEWDLGNASEEETESGASSSIVMSVDGSEAELENSDDTETEAEIQMATALSHPNEAEVDENDTGNGETLLIDAISLSWSQLSSANHPSYTPPTEERAMSTRHPIASVELCKSLSPSKPEMSSSVASLGPMLIVSKEEVFLANSSNTNLKVFSIRRPLHPERWATHLNISDRMCLTTQVAELGIFIVASTVGRAAVFSTYVVTKKEEEGVSDEEPRYGFNLEYILPFERESDTTVWNVETRQLIGVAVGPVQGALDKRSDECFLTMPRSWRLIMYYNDHTVLSFELWKKTAEKTMNLDDLII